MELNIDADSGGGGNDWFRVKYDSKAHLVNDTTEGYWIYHNETDSTNHAEVRLESDGNSRFLLGIVKPTGSQATGSIDLTFDGSGTDEWHIHDKSVDTWDDFYDDDAGATDRQSRRSVRCRWLGDRQRVDASEAMTNTKGVLVYRGGAIRLGLQVTSDDTPPRLTQGQTIGIKTCRHAI